MCREETKVSSVIICSECGKENSSDDLHCEYCGFPFNEFQECPDCGCKNLKDEKSCSNCGYPFQSKEINKTLKIPIFVIALALVLILTVISSAIGISKNKADFKDKLVTGSVWLEVETDSRVRFDENNKMMYMIYGYYGLDDGLEYSISYCDYKVKAGNKIKIGDETVKVVFRQDGKIMFEPDIVPIIKKAVKEAEKGE